MLDKEPFRCTYKSADYAYSHSTKTLWEFYSHIIFADLTFILQCVKIIIWGGDDND